MLEFDINLVTEECAFCRDPRSVVFTYTDDALSVRGVSYHHENGDLLRFAGELQALEQDRFGKASLFSKAGDSEFNVWFVRKGGEIRFSAKHELDIDAEGDLDAAVSYFGRVESEYVGSFLGEWISKIGKCQPAP